MGAHDDYGRAILRRASSAIELDGSAVAVDLGGGAAARIDGALPGAVAIEIESRTSKQVRGAILDLMLHDAPKKLLILVPKPMHNPPACREQCSNILNRFIPSRDFRVALLAGTGDAPRLELDVSIVKLALAELAE
jgi:hypothetical protein